ncbi:MAG: hypothetical protein ABII68_06040 [Pseudomonadota bacterium]
MTPVYFPFTYVSEPAAEAVSACFGQILVYQPSARNVPEQMRKWIESDILKTRVPAEGDEEKIDALLREYTDWLVLHQGSETAFLRSLGDAVPFFDESSTAQIQSDIRRKMTEGVAGKKADSEQQAPLFQARLFLRIAQEMDMQKSSVIQDLLKLEAMEKKLFENLSGEAAVPHMSRSESARYQADDPGSLMTRERIAAWTLLMLHDLARTGSGVSGLLVTTSRSIVDQLMEMDPAMQTAFEVGNVPVYESRTEEMEGWQGRLMEHLEMLVENPWPLSADAVLEPCPDGVCDKKVSLTIYIVPGVSPQEFFGRFVKHAMSQTPKKGEGGRIKNTVVGLVQS